jgi:hypothetical protein
MIRGVLLDEHYHGWWPQAILRICPTIDLRVINGMNAPPSGTKDQRLLEWIEAHDFVIVTEDRKTMPGHLKDHLNAGHHLEGIFILDKRVNVQVVAYDLALIVHASFDGEFRDQMVDLPL